MPGFSPGICVLRPRGAATPAYLIDNSLDFISVKARTGRARNASAKRSGLSVHNLSWDPFWRPTPFSGAGRETGTRVGGHDDQCHRIPGNGRRTPPPRRHVSVTRLT